MLKLYVLKSCVHAFLVMSHDSIREYVHPSVGWLVRRSIGTSVMLLSAGKDEPANNLFRVYKLAVWKKGINC